MDDRQLLELAAKAAGYEIIGWYGDVARLVGHGGWNPLDDDGDALRLSVKVGMLIDVRYTDPMARRCNDVTSWPSPSRGERIPFDPDELDPLAATRRAIVRAAAAIGAQS